MRCKSVGFRWGSWICVCTQLDWESIPFQCGRMCRRCEILSAEQQHFLKVSFDVSNRITQILSGANADVYKAASSF